MTAAAAGTTLAVAACGCGTSSQTGAARPPGPGGGGPVDVGPLSVYSTDGVYDAFAEEQNFFVVRENNRIFAVSAACTHRKCPLKKFESGIKCRCHGSIFTAAGHVTGGPAKVDLPRYAIERAATGNLLVHTDRLAAADDCLEVK